MMLPYNHGWHMAKFNKSQLSKLSKLSRIRPLGTRSPTILRGVEAGETDMDLSRTSEYWDDHAVRGDQNRAEWLAHPLIKERIVQVRGGHSLEHWFIERYLGKRRVARAIGIGCGVASFELGLMRLGAVEQYDLYDVSQVALDTAMETARTLGLAERVHIFRQDVNHEILAPNTYDLVTFISSLHHIADLDGVLRRVNEALTPQGLLFANEYVGPDRFAYPEHDSAFAKRLYRVLDPRLRSPWPELPQPNPADVEAADPTESIHSADIIETVKRVFDQIEITPLEYTLTFILWWGLNHDALYDTEPGRELVNVVLDIDNALVTSGRLPNYFSYIVARKQQKWRTGN
jgi:SAM-dependent methyltransferase